MTASGASFTPSVSELTKTIATETESLSKTAGALLKALEGGEESIAALNGTVPDAAELTAAVALAKLKFDAGQYSKAAELLNGLRSVTEAGSETGRAVLWGALAANALSSNWDAAQETIYKLRDVIGSVPQKPNESASEAAAAALEARTWLIHCSLFVFMQPNGARTGILDMLVQDRFMNAIQTRAPWILRYLAVAVITNKRRRNAVKDLVRVLDQESKSYKDPITEFLQALCVDLDFDDAEEKLRECGDVLRSDYFLHHIHEDFMENARMFIFETYCQIHKRIEISHLAKKLSMDESEAERWIVNLIRHVRLDAKIDSAGNTVHINATHASVYQQVIEKTKAISFRSYFLANTAEKALKSSSSSTETTTAATAAAATE